MPVLVRDLNTLCVVVARASAPRAELESGDGGGGGGRVQEGRFPLLRELTVAGARPKFVFTRAEEAVDGTVGAGAEGACYFRAWRGCISLRRRGQGYVTPLRTRIRCVSTCGWEGRWSENLPTTV